MIEEKKTPMSVPHVGEEEKEKSASLPGVSSASEGERDTVMVPPPMFPRPVELPYFHAVLQHIRSIVDLEYPFKDDWAVIKPPDWILMPTEPNPTQDMFVGTACTQRLM